MPLALDAIAPVVQILVTVTSHVSPTKTQERAADKEKKIATILNENRHLFSQDDLEELKVKEQL